MAFKAATATAATSAVATIDKAPQAAKVNLSEAIKRFEVEVTNLLAETTEIEDSWLPEEVTDAFKELTASIGFADYDPATRTTFFLKVGEDGRKMFFGPRLVAHTMDDGTATSAIVWGKEVVALDPAMKFDGENPLIVEELYCGLLLDASGYQMPVRVKFLDEYGKGDAFKAFKGQLYVPANRSAGGLSKFLAPMGSGFTNLKDLAEGPYKVVGFERGVGTNKKGIQFPTLKLAVEVNGKVVKIDGNYQIKNALEGEPEDTITRDRPAVLTITQQTTLKDGSVTTALSLVTAKLMESPLAAKLRARQDALSQDVPAAALKSAAVEEVAF